jgi:spore germination protein GerM
MGKIEIREPKKVILLGGLTVVLVILILIFFFGGGTGEKIKRLAGAGPAKPEPASIEPPAVLRITLFFLAEGDELLHGEEREIVAGPSTAAEAERIIAELIRGSDGDLISPLPPETEVRQVFVTDEGVAYVDFSRDISEKGSFGSSAELSAVFAVVNSLAYNLKAVKKVAILIEGGERDTLGGHVDLTKPFSPDYSVITK